MVTKVFGMTLISITVHMLVEGFRTNLVENEMMDRVYNYKKVEDLAIFIQYQTQVSASRIFIFMVSTNEYWIGYISRVQVNAANIYIYIYIIALETPAKQTTYER